MLLRSWLALLLALLLGAGLTPARPAWASAELPNLPERLSDTGLFSADGVVPYEPRHPLWSDGATKRRWLRLPPGTHIDTADADAWRFPVGTQLWKEFAHGDRVETRYMVRAADGAWRYASYRWRADGRDADRVADRGLRRAAVAAAPDGRYDFPSVDDCLACHDGARSPVLGYSAVQLGAPVTGASAAERAARGYLHGNCGHCHFSTGVPRPLRLAVDVGATEAPALPLDRLLARMASRDPYRQMPPLGTRHPDPAGLALVQAWRDSLPAPPMENPR